MTESAIPNPHEAMPPSAWLRRWAHLIPSGGSVLDLACGTGRNARWLASRGFAVTGVDRDADALARLPAGVEVVQADLEQAPWPFAGRRFDAIVVCHYLWRPLFPMLADRVSASGVLVYETFASGNEAHGRPRRPEFLLQPGELLQRVKPPQWQVVAYEEGRLEQPRPRVLQRIVALRCHGHHAWPQPPQLEPPRPVQMEPPGLVQR